MAGWLAITVVVAGVLIVVLTTSGKTPRTTPGTGTVTPSPSPAAPPADRVLSSTATEPGGTITVRVRYQPAAGGRLTLRAVRATFGSQTGYARPSFAFVLRARTGATLAHFSSSLKQASAATSDDTGWIRITGQRYAAVPAGAAMTVTMQAASTAQGTAGKLYPVLVTGVILTPPSALARQ
jgi:hypothetical protein